MRVTGIHQHAKGSAHAAVILQAQQSGRGIAAAAGAVAAVLMRRCVVMERLEYVIERLLIGIEAHCDGCAAAQAGWRLNCGRSCGRHGRCGCGGQAANNGCRCRAGKVAITAAGAAIGAVSCGSQMNSS